MMNELSQIIAQIEPVDPAWLARAQERLDSLTKPQGSLGRLEELAARYVAIRQDPMPDLQTKWVVVFAADHGVVAEGVSAFPQDVTFQMVYNFLQGGAGINVLARQARARVEVVDIGVNHDFAEVPELISRKVAYGSRNMAQEPAMTREEALRALLVGVERAEAATAAGVDVVAAGDMGIGNSTPAAALAAVFTGRPVSVVTGPGHRHRRQGLATQDRGHQPGHLPAPAGREGPVGGPGRGGGPGDRRHCRAHPGLRRGPAAPDAGRLHRHRRGPGGRGPGAGGDRLPHRRPPLGGAGPPDGVGFPGAETLAESQYAPGRRHRRRPGHAAAGGRGQDLPGDGHLRRSRGVGEGRGVKGERGRGKGKDELIFRLLPFSP